MEAPLLILQLFANFKIIWKQNIIKKQAFVVLFIKVEGKSRNNPHLKNTRKTN